VTAQKRYLTVSKGRTKREEGNDGHPAGPFQRGGAEDSIRGKKVLHGAATPAFGGGPKRNGKGKQELHGRQDSTGPLHQKLTENCQRKRKCSKQPNWGVGGGVHEKREACEGGVMKKNVGLKPKGPVKGNNRKWGRPRRKKSSPSHIQSDGGGGGKQHNTHGDRQVQSIGHSKGGGPDNKRENHKNWGEKNNPGTRNRKWII